MFLFKMSVVFYCVISCLLLRICSSSPMNYHPSIYYRGPPVRWTYTRFNYPDINNNHQYYRGYDTNNVPVYHNYPYFRGFPPVNTNRYQFTAYKTHENHLQHQPTTVSSKSFDGKFKSYSKKNQHNVENANNKQSKNFNNFMDDFGKKYRKANNNDDTKFLTDTFLRKRLKVKPDSTQVHPVINHVNKIKNTVVNYANVSLSSLQSNLQNIPQLFNKTVSWNDKNDYVHNLLHENVSSATLETLEKPMSPFTAEYPANITNIPHPIINENSNIMNQFSHNTVDVHLPSPTLLSVIVSKVRNISQSLHASKNKKKTVSSDNFEIMDNNGAIDIRNFSNVQIANVDKFEESNEQIIFPDDINNSLYLGKGQYKDSSGEAKMFIINPAIVNKSSSLNFNTNTSAPNYSSVNISVNGLTQNNNLLNYNRTETKAQEHHSTVISIVKIHDNAELKDDKRINILENRAGAQESEYIQGKEFVSQFDDTNSKSISKEKIQSNKESRVFEIENVTPISTTNVEIANEHVTTYKIEVKKENVLAKVNNEVILPINYTEFSKSYETDSRLGIYPITEQVEYELITKSPFAFTGVTEIQIEQETFAPETFELSTNEILLDNFLKSLETGSEYFMDVSNTTEHMDHIIENVPVTSEMRRNFDENNDSKINSQVVNIGSLHNLSTVKTNVLNMKEVVENVSSLDQSTIEAESKTDYEFGYYEPITEPMFVKNIKQFALESNIPRLSENTSPDLKVTTEMSRRATPIATIKDDDILKSIFDKYVIEMDPGDSHENITPKDYMQETPFVEDDNTYNKKEVEIFLIDSNSPSFNLAKEDTEGRNRLLVEKEILNSNISDLNLKNASELGSFTEKYASFSNNLSDNIVIDKFHSNSHDAKRKEIEMENNTEMYQLENQTNGFDFTRLVSSTDLNPGNLSFAKVDVNTSNETKTETTLIVKNSDEIQKENRITMDEVQHIKKGITGENDFKFEKDVAIEKIVNYKVDASKLNTTDANLQKEYVLENSKNNSTTLPVEEFESRMIDLDKLNLNLKNNNLEHSDIEDEGFIKYKPVTKIPNRSDISVEEDLGSGEADFDQWEFL